MKVIYNTKLYLGNNSKEKDQLAFFQLGKCPSIPEIHVAPSSPKSQWMMMRMMIIPVLQTFLSYHKANNLLVWHSVRGATVLHLCCNI